MSRLGRSMQPSASNELGVALTLERYEVAVASLRIPAARLQREL